MKRQNPKKMFGATVRHLREKHLRTDDHFTLRQFARTIGVSPTYLSKVETGDFPPPSEERIISIANALGEDPDKLLSLAGKVSPDLIRIILNRPRVMPGLIRKAGRMTEKTLETILSEFGRASQNTR